MYRLGLESLYALRLHRLLAPFCGGAGVIFTLHHVRPAQPSRFQPNAFLEVTPDFLGIAIERIKALGFDLVSLDEARRRLIAGDRRRFACFTLDDGYRDNLEFGLPVFAAHDCPFTVFVTSSFVAGTGEIYWKALEAVVAGSDTIALDVEGLPASIPSRTIAEKNAAYRQILRTLDAAGETEKRRVIRALCDKHGFDMAAHCRTLSMTWGEVRHLAAQPLACIGAHTIHHFALASLSERDAWHELAGARDEIEQKTGFRPGTLAYPYGSRSEAGDREFRLAAKAGYDLAVTTRPGVLKRRDAGSLHSLPRVSLNGLYQEARFVDVLASGVPFSLLDAARRLRTGSA